MNARSETFPGPLGDRPLLAVTLLLTAAGVAMIYSAGVVDFPSVVTGLWKRQLVWAVLAVVAMWVTSRVPLRWMEWGAPWMYGISVVLLALTLVVGTGPGGTSSWLELGPLRMQPSELAKLSTILMLARELSGRREPAERLIELWRPLGIALLPLGLVMLQPDLGSALIFGVILVAALFWAGVPVFTIFLLISPGISLILGFSAWAWGIWFIALAALLYVRQPYLVETIGVVLANAGAGALTQPIWEGLAPYQQNRLLVFLNPQRDPQGAGWHLIQSKVAIGSGGWTGQGFTEGPQKRLAFLPEQHTDFIFSVVGEELGFVGVFLLLAGFAWWLSRTLKVAGTAYSDFGSVATFSFFSLWLIHLLINVGMTVGLMPITGLPLPLLSYGGSFLVVTYLGLGIVQRTAIED